MTNIGESCGGVTDMITNLVQGLIKIIMLPITILQQIAESFQGICSGISI